MYHKITIIGNLGRDPEMRYTPDGTPVTTFSVATNRRWTNPDGSQGEETIWFRVTAWRRLAETAADYLRKGRQVYIEGRLQPDKNTGGPRVYQRQDGTSGASYEVVADLIKFIGARPESDWEEAEAPVSEDTQEMPF